MNLTSTNATLESENNLAMHYYTPWEYQVASIIEILSIIVSAVSILMFFVGFLGGKLIVIEFVGIIQLCWLSLITVK